MPQPNFDTNWTRCSLYLVGEFCWCDETEDKNTLKIATLKEKKTNYFLRNDFAFENAY
jgi:hypothetical protein